MSLHIKYRGELTRANIDHFSFSSTNTNKEKCSTEFGIIEIGQEQTFRLPVQQHTQHYFIAQNYLTKNLRCAVSIREFAETYRVTSDQTIEQHFEHCHSSSSGEPGRRIGKCKLKLSMFAWSLDLDKKLEMNVGG